uniref:Secreted protein n=1 Tax=Phytophthora fragariae TaxID=53985 RepID=A0A6A3DDT3_9STRA|nr:hypothetical protein PF009_g31253 [Phytophthora fragariae]KAE8918433.1 hypothetical protein PF009_g31253 [Phytophthora fragariae]
MWSTPNCSLCLILPFAAPQSHLSAIPASKDLVLAIVGSAHLFQAPNVIRSPVASVSSLLPRSRSPLSAPKVIQSPAAVVFYRFVAAAQLFQPQNDSCCLKAAPVCFSLATPQPFE